jgi:hypothetical protein
MAHDVCIVHAPEDDEAAAAACRHLESGGLRCWIAPRDLLPGVHAGEAARGAVRASRLVLVVLSPHVDRAPGVRAQLELTAQLALPVVEVRLEGTRARRLDHVLDDLVRDVRRLLDLRRKPGEDIIPGR